MGKYLIKIVPDTEMPLNPRVDYDNLCVMACFHSRSCLGDQARKSFKWPNTREGMAEFKEIIRSNFQIHDHFKELTWKGRVIAESRITNWALPPDRKTPREFTVYWIPKSDVTVTPVDVVMAHKRAIKAVKA